jgi:hypothetical protein
MVDTRRPDIVLFVNGIPFIVIDVKCSAIDTEQGISQQIRNQNPDGENAQASSAPETITTDGSGSPCRVVGLPKAVVRISTKGCHRTRFLLRRA